MYKIYSLIEGKGSRTTVRYAVIGNDFLRLTLDPSGKYYEYPSGSLLTARDKDTLAKMFMEEAQTFPTLKEVKDYLEVLRLLD